jgi:hypothetical protein
MESAGDQISNRQAQQNTVAIAAAGKVDWFGLKRFHQNGKGGTCKFIK